MTQTFRYRLHSVAATVPLGQAPKSASERLAELLAKPGREAQSPGVLAWMATAVHGRDIPKAPGKGSGLTAQGAQRDSRRYRRQSFLPSWASWREIPLPHPCLGLHMCRIFQHLLVAPMMRL